LHYLDGVRIRRPTTAAPPATLMRRYAAPSLETWSTSGKDTLLLFSPQHHHHGRISQRI
jgi:hypothetical protein